MTKTLLLSLIMFLFIIPVSVKSASVSFLPVNQTSSVENPHPSTLKLKAKDVEKLLGRKLTLKERMGLFLLKRLPAEANAGRTALTFGILAAALFVLGLFVPYVIIGAFIAAIVAIVLGTVAKKENPSDRKAVAATLLGWITLGATALLLLLAVLVVAAWF